MTREALLGFPRPPSLLQWSSVLFFHGMAPDHDALSSLRVRRALCDYPFSPGSMKNPDGCREPRCIGVFGAVRSSVLRNGRRFYRHDW